MVAAAIYAWRRRSAPGALLFAVTTCLALPWALGEALVLVAVDAPAKIFWAKFRTVWMLPIGTATLCFALDYANLGRWLNRRTLSLLGIPPLLFLILAVTNDAHHLLWLNFSVRPYVLPQYGIAGWIDFCYGLSLMTAVWLVFLWLFLRSPLHRRAMALCLCGQFVVLVAIVLGHSNLNPTAPMDPLVIASALLLGAYALALFRFHMFDLISVARGTMIEQMREGMVVLDPQQRIVNLNPAAEQILGMAAAQAIGRKAAEVFPAFRAAESEATLGAGDAARHYVLHHSALKDRRGFPLGSLILLHDITEQKRAQAELLEHRSALATQRERDRVARELHDGLAQMLAYMKMQAEVAQTFLARDQPSEANGRLARIATAAQAAHADVREYILGARAGVSASAAFLPSLEDYLGRFSENYGIATKLTVSPELSRDSFEPMVEAQLLRMIQEALTNARKHARARGVDIRLGTHDGRAEAIVQDDGVGFDPSLVEAGEGLSFGLHYMRERAEEVGGSVHIDSAPGKGTQVIISVPLRRDWS